MPLKGIKRRTLQSAGSVHRAKPAGANLTLFEAPSVSATGSCVALRWASGFSSVKEGAGSMPCRQEPRGQSRQRGNCKSKRQKGVSRPWRLMGGTGQVALQQERERGRRRCSGSPRCGAPPWESGPPAPSESISKSESRARRAASSADQPRPLSGQVGWSPGSLPRGAPFSSHKASGPVPRHHARDLAPVRVHAHVHLTPGLWDPRPQP